MSAEGKQGLVDSFQTARKIKPYTNSRYSGWHPVDGVDLPDQSWDNGCMAMIRYTLGIKFDEYLFAMPWPVKHELGDTERYIRWLFSDKSPWRDALNTCVFLPDDASAPKVTLEDGSVVSIRSEEFHTKIGFFLEDFEVNVQFLASFYKALRLPGEVRGTLPVWCRLQDEFNVDPVAALMLCPVVYVDNLGYASLRSTYPWHSLWTSEQYITNMIANMRDQNAQFKTGYDTEENSRFSNKRVFYGCDYIFTHEVPGVTQFYWNQIKYEYAKCFNTPIQCTLKGYNKTIYRRIAFAEFVDNLGKVFKQKGISIYNG